ncbi:hypothetical protein PoB_006187700 [Plakobranchus ocellatus]|uniref:Uncharacterized protein n=1 Tax=Plakobranchus ocellatus TaxID=259542 RepID=A0AAV4CTZ1_9GAST|nr:hypothetical protein PoB_006187700 [Plakobranchus ocellatus]
MAVSHAGLDLAEEAFSSPTVATSDVIPATAIPPLQAVLVTEVVRFTGWPRIVRQLDAPVALLCGVLSSQIVRAQFRRGRFQDGLNCFVLATVADLCQDTLPEKKDNRWTKSGNQGQKEKTGADHKQDGWMTSGKQQAQNAEEGTRSEKMDDICRGLHPAVDE